MDSFSVAAERHVKTTLAEMRAETIDHLPVDIRRRLLKEAREITNKNVFGEGYKKDAAGNPQEQGIGSPGNMTQQAIEAYVKDQTDRRIGGPEPGYEENLTRMRKQLAECDDRRKTERAAREAEES